MSMNSFEGGGERKNVTYEELAPTVIDLVNQHEDAKRKFSALENKLTEISSLPEAERPPTNALIYERDRLFEELNRVLSELGKLGNSTELIEAVKAKRREMDAQFKESTDASEESTVRYVDFRKKQGVQKDLDFTGKDLDFTKKASVTPLHPNKKDVA